MIYLRWIVLVLILCSSGVSASETVVTVNARDQLHLAQTLSKQGDYLAAANEFIRFIHLFPGHPSVPEARYQAGTAYFDAGRAREAARHLKMAAYDYGSDPVSIPAMFKLSELHVKTQRPGDAVMVLRNLIMLARDVPTKDRACFTLGWLMLEHEEQIQSGSDYPVYPVKEAVKYFSMISVQGKQTYGIQALTERLEGIHGIKQKNPVTAGVLSIIPGGGFLYCGRYRDALVSFLFNTTLILAAYQSFENDNPFLGGILAFVESGFYTGNIYGSVTSAHKYNRKKKKEYIETLKHDQSMSFPNLSFRAKENQMEMAVTFKYQF
jgi:hypothetical protein